MRTHLDLCSGIGGFALALKHLVGGFQTIGYVEIERYCREVLRSRIRDGILDDAPIFDDVRAFPARSYRGMVDCLTAGFPCQPFSVAGKQLGADDPRNLWPDIARVIREVAPATVLLENVPALLRRYAGTVFGTLAACGYDTQWDCIPASAVGANHRRDRLWIVANANRERAGVSAGDSEPKRQTRPHTDAPRTTMVRPKYGQTHAKGVDAGGEDVADTSSDLRGASGDDGHEPPDRTSNHVADATGKRAERLSKRPGRQNETSSNAFRGSEDVADADKQGPQGRLVGELQKRAGERVARAGGTHDTGRVRGENRTDWWLIEPDVGRVADGVPARVDRLKSLGNAIVPAVARKAWETLTEETP